MTNASIYILQVHQVSTFHWDATFTFIPRVEMTKTAECFEFID